MRILCVFETDVFIVQNLLYKTWKIVFTIYYMGLHGNTGGYKGLQGVTGGYTKYFFSVYFVKTVYPDFSLVGPSVG